MSENELNQQSNLDDDLASFTMAGLIAAAGIWTVGQSLFGKRAKLEKKVAEARSLININAFDKAFNLLVEVTQDDWEYGAAHYELGRLYLYVYNDPQNAYSAVQEAIKLANNELERAAAIAMLADGYLMHHNYQRAVAAFNDALRRLQNGDPGQLRPYILLRLSTCYRMMQDFNTAAQLIAEVLQMDPQNQFALQQQGELYYEMTRRSLYHGLVTHFSLDELRVLCFELSVDYESLSSSGGKESKVVDLITLFERRFGSIQPLINAVKRKRPFLEL